MSTLRGKYFRELYVVLGTVSKGNTFYCNLRLTLSLVGSFCDIWVTIIRFQMTRYVSSCFITLLVLFLWRVEDIAEACKCSPPHPQQAFCDADIVIRAKVVGKKALSNEIKYDIQQIKMFKCPNQVIHAIYTASSPAACGVTLEINKEYLFTGKLETGRMHVTLCGYNPPWEDVSAAQKNGLTRLYKSGCDCKIIHCNSLPCPISTTDACLWMDWGTNNGQNLACIKSNGSCAWK